MNWPAGGGGGDMHGIYKCKFAVISLECVRWMVDVTDQRIQKKTKINENRIFESSETLMTMYWEIGFGDMDHPALTLQATTGNIHQYRTYLWQYASKCTDIAMLLSIAGLTVALLTAAGRRRLAQHFQYCRLSPTIAETRKIVKNNIKDLAFRSEQNTLDEYWSMTNKTKMWYLG